jgi:hypothetical protein
MVRSRSTQGVALLALLAPFTLGSCVADSVSLRITCDVAPEDDCTYEEGADCYVNGELNVHPGDMVSMAAQNYKAVLRVVNGLKPRDREVPPLSETNGIQIYQFEVRIKDSAGETLSLSGLPNPYTVPASGFIEPADEGLVGSDLIPNAYITPLRMLHGNRAQTTINLDVIARGKTSGDVEVESAAWPWFINIRSVNPNAGVSTVQCIPVEESVCTMGQDRYVFACDPRTVEGGT